MQVDRKEIQEHVFVLLMLSLVFLYRENPLLVYPQVLSLLFALLAYNFFQHRFLKRVRYALLFHAFSLIVNTAVVGGIIHFSGGKDSSFWVLLLLPLFSSVIMHNTKTMWLTLVLVLTVLLTFYMELILNGNNNDTILLGTKSAVLILAFLFTKRLAISERKAHSDLSTQRESLTELEKQVEASTLQTDKMVNLGHLTTSIAHDINNPIAVILGYSDLLLAELPRDSKHVEDVMRIQQSALFCRNLASNILGMARREDYTLRRTSIRDVFDNTWKLCETQFRHENVTMNSEFEDGLCKLFMSAVHIQQVILNLLTNARQATPAGGNVTVKAFRDNGRLSFSVRDQGPGIPEGKEEEIFKPFFTSKSKGTGMGLHIVRQIIERHHGQVHAGNAKEGGAIFTFALPVD